MAEKRKRDPPDDNQMLRGDDAPAKKRLRTFRHGDRANSEDIMETARINVEKISHPQHQHNKNCKTQGVPLVNFTMAEKRKRDPLDDNQLLRGDDAPAEKRLRTFRHADQAIPGDIMTRASTSVDKTSSPQNRHDKTFRVQGIPLTYSSKSDVEMLIKTALQHKNGTTLPVCHSLALDHSGKHRVATITFDNNHPQCLRPESLPFHVKVNPKVENSARLSFDDSFLGLTALHSCSKETHDINVIALSGIGGHAFGSFKARSSRYMWLRDRLPDDLPRSWIMTWGYDATIAGSSSSQNISDIATRLRQDLLNLLDNLGTKRFIFLAHSLGGLVLKSVLISLCQSQDTQAKLILDHISTIILCGVPSYGLEKGVVDSLVQMAESQPNEQLVRSIGPNSELLSRLQNDFKFSFSKENFPRSTIYTVYETTESSTAIQENGRWRMTGPQMLYVTKLSATASRRGEDDTDLTLAFDLSHSDLVKFSSGSEYYSRIMNFMKRACGGPIVDQKQDEEHHKKLIQSLNFDQMFDRQRNIQHAYGDTCQWLVESSRFQDWRDWNNAAEHHGFFWLKGNPGMGKSTLTNFALSETKATYQDAIHLSFFFSRRGMILEKEISGMYRSLLFQLFEPLSLSGQPSIFAELDPPIQLGKIPSWTIGMLKELLYHALQRLSQKRLFLFVDALDECNTDEFDTQIKDMVEFFQRLGKQRFDNSGASLNIFFSSRHYPTITIDKGVEMHLETEDNHAHDIEIYIQSKLKSLGNSKWATKVRTRILEKAQGVFLWVVLVISILTKEFEDGEKAAVTRKLNEIPSDLKDLFEGILMRDSRKMDRMKLCIQWILFSQKPLRPEELYHAVLSGTNADLSEGNESDSDSDAYSDSNFDSDSDSDSDKSENREAQVEDEDFIRRFIVASSKGLAAVTRSAYPTVQLIHESVQEYLLKDGLKLLQIETGHRHGLSHDLLKVSCEKYINNKRLKERLSRSLSTPLSAKARSLRQFVSKKYPFLRYAVHSIFYHAELAARSSISQVRFLETFQLLKWIQLSNIFENDEFPGYTIEATLTYIFAERNYPSLIQAIQTIHRGKINLDEGISGERYIYPIYAALEKKNFNAVKAILSVPCSNDYNQPEYTTLDNLVREYERRVKGTKRKPPVYFLSDTCAPSKLLDLVQTGQLKVDNKMDNIGQTLLSSFASNGHIDLVKGLLTSPDSNINSRDPCQRTALSRTAENGHSEIVKLLLEAGADISLIDDRGLTALSMAARNGHEEIVKLLIEAKDNVNLIDYYGRTPLSWAARNGHEEIVKLLLEAKADVSLKDDSHDGVTALSWAAGNGHQGIVKLLLEAKADINLKDLLDGETPLSWATKNGHEKVVKLLLKAKADVNLRDHYGRTPLSWAAENRHQVIFRLLLNAEAKVELKNSASEVS